MCCCIAVTNYIGMECKYNILNSYSIQISTASYCGSCDGCTSSYSFFVHCCQQRVEFLFQRQTLNRH